MYFSSQGIHTKQAHKGIPEGCVEEEQGRKGFYGQVSHLIKKKGSTRWKTIEGPLKPRMFDLVKADRSGKRQRLLYNHDLAIHSQWMFPDDAKKLTAFRDADGDLLYFCHIGEGQLLTEYGMFDYRPGDYIVMPKCFAHVFLPKGASQFLVIENLSGDFREPDRGMAGKKAVYDTAQLTPPDLTRMQEFLKKNGLCCLNVEVKHSGELTHFLYEDCVFDVLGWKGDLFPFKINMDQLMPLMSHRAHLPPSAHTTFVAPRFVVCTFVPRPFESDPGAIKIPFFHNNDDYDEVIFYHRGDFFSRDNIHPGMITLHPCGFTHGPHPKALGRMLEQPKPATDEYAVMIDTRDAVDVDPAASGVEWTGYVDSWKPKAG